MDHHVAPGSRPRLLYFFDQTDGRARRIEGFLAQILQRRRNHETFVVHRIEMSERPDLIARFKVSATPAFIVVNEKRVEGRLEDPRSAIEIESLLGPWLR